MDKLAQESRYPGLLVVIGVILAIGFIGSALVEVEEVLRAREAEPLPLLGSATLGHLVVDVEVPLATLLVADTGLSKKKKKKFFNGS